jgi:hypothetical protein
MRFLTVVLFASAVTFAQTPGKMITFNRADTEHCKVVVVGGTPLLESTYEGTSVAIAMPVNKGNGEFVVFVAVSRASGGTVQVDPKDIYGLYPDATHTRFTFMTRLPKSVEQEPQGCQPPIHRWIPRLFGLAR